LGLVIMPDYHFYYTSREAAQGIGSAGRVEAGASGWIYLTPDLYEEGTRAADALAIEDKSIEVVALIPSSMLMPPPKTSLVLPTYDPVGGRVRRKGGGVQARIPGPLASAEIRWLALSPP
jgi:hypothetical protein